MFSKSRSLCISFPEVNQTPSVSPYTKSQPLFIWVQKPTNFKFFIQIENQVPIVKPSVSKEYTNESPDTTVDDRVKVTHRMGDGPTKTVSLSLSVPSSGPLKHTRSHLTWVVWLLVKTRTVLNHRTGKTRRLLRPGTSTLFGTHDSSFFFAWTKSDLPYFFYTK